MKQLINHISKNIDRFNFHVPSAQAIHRFVDQMIQLMFPVRMGEKPSPAQIEKSVEELSDTLSQFIERTMGISREKAESLTLDFFDRLPQVYDHLMEDAENFCRLDPAAKCINEVVICYPGFYAIAIYRISNILFRLGIPILPRVISEYAHSKTGIDLHPGASIGRGFYIDHGTGVVIGETTVIGENVKIYQGVTLGALYVEKSLEGTKRHPTIEDNVIIYAGSTILGGETRIGHDTIVGGNVWLTESVPAFSFVVHKPSIEIRAKR